ncbi:GOS9-like protein [Tanacetum coccineum]
MMTTVMLLVTVADDGDGADVKVGGWGGDGGRGEWEWPFAAGSNLSKIQVISNAECIVSVMFTTHSPQGGQHNSKKYGGAGVKGPGILTHNIQLGFGELVSEIRGTYAVYQTVTVITSLTFVVGTQENGPYGKVNGTAFSLPVINATHNVVGIGVEIFDLSYIMSLTVILSFLRSLPKHNLTSSCNKSPSCALVNEYLTSEFAEALTPL